MMLILIKLKQTVNPVIVHARHVNHTISVLYVLKTNTWNWMN